MKKDYSSEDNISPIRKYYNEGELSLPLLNKNTNRNSGKRDRNKIKKNSNL